MEQVKNNKRQKFDILLILALFVIARISCPALSNIPIFSMAFTFIYGVAFIFLFFFIVRKMNIQDFYLMASAILYTVYVFFRGFTAGKGLFARDPFNAYIIVFLTMIYLWSKGKPLETKVFLFKFILFALTFDYVYSIYVLFQDPDASRISASISVLERSPYDVLNAVGGFDAVYGCLSVVVILLFMRQALKKTHTKSAFTFLVLILALIFIIMASYATAILLLTLAVAFFLSKKNKIFSGILFLSLVFILICHKPIGQWFMDMSYGITYFDTLSEKMNDFGYMLKNFETAGTYAGDDGRTSKMIFSWETFLKYPIFGGMGMKDAKVYGHCELLDFPGNFGLVGFVFLINYFVCLYKNVRDELTSIEMRNCWKIILFVFVLSAALNPSLYSLQMMPIILMMPLSSSYLKMCENKRMLGDKI